MWRVLRNLILLMAVVLGLSARAFATATATITVGGSEQQVSGVWDTKAISMSFNGYTETVSPGQFSTTASIASAFAAQFSRDYAHAGLSAQVVCGTNSSLITLRLGGAATFGTLDVTGSTTSFQMSAVGFLAVSSQVFDTGTVTLTVNNITAATTNYGADATPATIAAGLAAGVTVGSFVSVKAVNDGLYLEAKQAGAGTNYSYSISAVSTDGFATPSFPNPAISGSLTGGANAGTGQPQSIYSFNGTYDGVGNVTGYSDSTMGNWSFTYDTLNRLETGNSSSGSYTNQYLCWAYDSFGNRTAELLQTAVCPSSESSVTPTAAFNNSNQATSASGIGSAAGYTFTATYGYDPAGNVTSDSLNQYLYDAEGRLCAVESVKFGNSMIGYLYDAEGTRVAKGSISSMSCDPTVNHFTPVSDYILGPSNEQLTELDMDPNQGVMAWQHTNIWAGGRLLGTYDADGTHFYFDDPLGTRRAQTDYAGVLENTCQSLPYGNSESCPPSPTEHLFTGKERDTESGLDYFGARYYASNMGRFMSPDDGSDWDPSDPQSWNLYSYVRNNPLKYTDPTGHDCVYLNDSGTGVSGPTGEVDHNSNVGECIGTDQNGNLDGHNGGYWVEGSVDPNSVSANANTGQVTVNGGASQVLGFQNGQLQASEFGQSVTVNGSSFQGLNTSSAVSSSYLSTQSLPPVPPPGMHFVSAQPPRQPVPRPSFAACVFAPDSVNDIHNLQKGMANTPSNDTNGGGAANMFLPGNQRARSSSGQYPVGNQGTDAQLNGAAAAADWFTSFANCASNP